MSRPRVLVLDGDQPAALAIVRSLGKKGLEVHAGERRAGFLSAASRYTHRVITYPDPLADAAAFADAIAAEVRRTHYALVIPVAEDTVHPLAIHRAEIEPHAHLAVAPTDALETMLDKDRTFALARSVGVPVPESWTFTDAAELAAAAGGFRYPVVVKPSRSIANGAARRKLNVMYAHDPAQLLAMCKEPLAAGAVIVQEYFRGAGVGVELLADHGDVVYAFQHRRLHELPLTGGGSCLRESVPVHPALLEDARRLMHAARWHGVAMVEFKLDEATGERRLMEVNGRFWGSLPLAVAAGADFPFMLYQLLAEGRRPDLPPARTGVVCRKLSADVYWYVQVLNRDQDEPLIEWPSKRGALQDALLAFSPRHHFDVQSLVDPRPGVVDAWRTGEWFAERVRAVADQRWVRHTQAREQRRGDFAARRMRGVRELLFVCYGNINRSILAERHLRALLPAGAPLSVASAGFHPESGRPADPSMVREAARHGLSLEGAASRTLDAEMVARADLILVMEVKHLLRLREEHPGAMGKAFLLGCASPAVPLEIADPYGGDEAAFAECHRHVTTCTGAIAATLDRVQASR